MKIIMKKSYLILAVVAASFAACSQNDVVTEITETDVLIGFSGTYVDNATRAISTGAYTAANFETLGNTFGVFGYKNTATQTDAQVFNDTEVEYQSGLQTSVGYEATTDWAYSPLKYWDKTATSYNFYAYAPHQSDFTGTVALSGNSANSFSISGFQQATTKADMIDLMTDLTTKASVTTGIGTNDVSFTFGHILSNINVKMAVSDALKSDNANNPVTVVSISLGTIKMDGDYAYSSSAYAWTLASTPHTATFSGTQTSGNVFASDVLTGTTTGYTDVPGLTDLLFVPQAVDAAYAFNVQFKIANEIFDKTILLSEFKNVTDNTTGLATWQPGYKYTYQIVIGPTPILFDVQTVSDWADGGTFAFTIE